LSDKTIVVATITCEYKLYSTGEVVENNASLDVPDGWTKRVYVNAEMSKQKIDVPEGVALDVWTWESSWRGERKFDQEQPHRLPAICLARNMAREYALRAGADAMLFVDSDVLVPKDSLVRLLAEDYNIVGGVVPGRGAHGHVIYAGSGKHQELKGKVLETDYGTAGFVLLRKPVIQSIGWRWGWTHEGSGPMSEDPLFAYDARKAGFGWWYILMDLRASHADKAARLTDKEVAAF